MSDLASIPGGREAWHQLVSACFTASINAQKRKLSAADGGSQPVQFFDPTHYDQGEAHVIQAVAQIEVGGFAVRHPDRRRCFFVPSLAALLSWQSEEASIAVPFFPTAECRGGSHAD
jgi:hypothetical protein